VLSNQGKHAEALAPLQSARALAATANRGERHDTKLLLNLARAYYANKNYGQAIYHYMQVPRSSEFWADAHFEQAWAHFRGQDMTGTLGLLHTSTSPFLEQVWAPEAHMLRAQSLFMMCKFTSAIEAIDTFEQQYHPVQAELDAALVGLDAVGAWNDVTGWLDGGTSKLPVRVIRRYQAEDRLAERRRAVGVYDAELGKTAVAGARADRVASLVQGRRDALIADEGARILDAARTRSRELADLLTGIELARIDILQLSSRMYERAAATGEAVEHGDRIGKLRELRKRQKGYDVWPFEGEYWADELGWYQVDARSDCPESMARKIE
jgi:tetratricopeptide (TPR) repeat protein